MTLKILDLFSGLGGFSLGLERTGHFKTIAFCDNDKYCNLVLQKHWKGVKIYNDVKEITKERLEADGVEAPDIITGGFPCQPFSVAGKQKGTSDDRHLWPEMFRIIKAFKPRFVIGENVPGIVNIQDGVVFETVCTDLESQGYEVQPFNIPASAVGAPHQRKRIWIIASLEDSRRTLQQRTELREKNEDEVGKENANQHQRSSSSSESNVANTEQSRPSSESIGNIGSVEEESSREKERGNQSSIRTSTRSTDVADTYARLSDGTYKEVQSGRQTFDTSSEGSEDVANTESSDRHDNEAITRNGESSTQEVFGNGSSLSGEGSWWHVEPDVGRVAHGIPGRVYRLKGLGNSIVPKIVEEIGYAIIKAAERKE